MQRCLVPEVREEVQRYFGRIDCLEAQYPGLDYTFEPHRQRLRSFTWHRRLFRAFDELKLTNDEILTLCNWEGTRAAKERFEREAHTTIESTTLDGIESEPTNNGPRAVFHPTPSRTAPRYYGQFYSGRYSVAGKGTAVDDESDEDESIGIPLNRHLIAAAEARDRGESDDTLRFDQAWEQWMKEAIERNEMSLDTILETIRQGRPFPSSSETFPSIHQQVTDPIPRQDSPMPEASARTYDQLHDMLDELQSTNARMAGDQTAEHTRLSNLVDELQTNATRLEAENTAMANFLSRTRTQQAR